MNTNIETQTRLEDCRKTILPDFINICEFREQISKMWDEKIIIQYEVNNHQGKKELPTLSIDLVIKAGNILATELVKLRMSNITILDIIAGNCAGSRVLLNIIKNYDLKKLIIKKWISTDIIDYKKTIKDKNHEFYKLNGLNSVENFGNQSDLLLLMCPPPNYVIQDNLINPMSLCDYYSIVDFIKMNKSKNKLIVFISELGASSGTIGMYHFMMTNKDIELTHREMIITSYQFGLIEIEIFIFKIL